MNEAPRRVANKQQLEKLIMDITSSDLNRQMCQLISDYKKTGDEHYKIDAEYLRSEFDTWWDDEVSTFAPPAAV
jgi:transposase